jgi:tight adherence protein C
MEALLLSLRALFGESHSSELAFILLCAAAVFALSLGIGALGSAVASPLRRRLGRLAHPEAPAARTTSAAALAERLRPLAPYVLPGKETERSRVQQLLMRAGHRSAGALSVFYGVKTLLIVTLPVMVLIASHWLPRLGTGMVVFLAFTAAFVGMLIPSMWLDHSVQSRQQKLRIAFPDALDLLVVCVESGLGLAAALQRVADELAVGHPELGTELALVNAEMRAGVERTQALKNFAERTGLEDIRGLVALMVQTMRFGTSIGDALRVYSEEFRDKRMQAAEEQAAKIGTKMIFPLVTCLFPSFFLVAVGPAVLRLGAVFSQLAH